MKTLGEIKEFLFKFGEKNGGCGKGQEFLKRNDLAKKDLVKFLFTNKGEKIGIKLFKTKEIKNIIDFLISDKIMNELKGDPDWVVRKAVVEQGYALDELKNDSYWPVREAVAEQGYALDELKDDPSPRVRAVVAKQGYALDELKNDPKCWLWERTEILKKK